MHKATMPGNHYVIRFCNQISCWFKKNLTAVAGETGQVWLLVRWELGLLGWLRVLLHAIFPKETNF